MKTLGPAVAWLICTRLPASLLISCAELAVSGRSFVRFPSMRADFSILVIVASLAGGVLGWLAVWNRRPRKLGGNHLVQAAVLLTGSVALVVSLLFFAKAFSSTSVVFAITVTLLVAAWTGMLRTVIPLPLPTPLREVRSIELAVLRGGWTGVSLFGVVLRNTPLRNLGGAVYLEQCGSDAECVLRGIRQAEEVHVWSVIFCAPWLVFLCLQGLWLPVGLSLAVHALLNIYPILHLRLARGRIGKYAAWRALHSERVLARSRIGHE